MVRVRSLVVQCRFSLSVVDQLRQAERMGSFRLHTVRPDWPIGLAGWSGEWSWSVGLAKLSRRQLRADGGGPGERGRHGCRWFVEETTPGAVDANEFAASSTYRREVG